MIFRSFTIFSQNQPSYTTHASQVSGNIDNILIQDLDGDDKLDLLVIHHEIDDQTSKPKRWISLFLYERDTLFLKPSQILPINHEEIVFDLYDLDQDQLPEIIFLKSNGLEIWKYTDSGYVIQPQPLLQTSSIFLAHDPFRLKFWKMCVQFNDQAAPTLIIPKSKEMALYSRNRFGHYELSQRLFTSPNYSLKNGNSIKFLIKPPQPIITDFNGDNIQDILFLSEKYMDVFLRHKITQSDDSCSLQPPSLRYRIDVMQANPSSIEEISPASMELKIHDLNRDGQTDLLLICAPRAGFTAHISHVQIYMNRWGKFSLIPDQILTAENLGGEHIIEDFNQDGLLDLALIQFQIGWFQAFKYLLTRKINLKLNFYLMTPAGNYMDSPIHTISFSKRIKIRDFFGSFQSTLSFPGYFNGDSIPDLLIHSDDDHFLILPGENHTLFSKKNTIKIHIRTSDHFKVTDINQDGISDICLWYPRKRSRSGKITLLISQKCEI